MLNDITFEIDPEWTVCRRFACGHVQHACCREHLDDICPLCVLQEESPLCGHVGPREATSTCVLPEEHGLETAHQDDSGGVWLS